MIKMSQISIRMKIHDSKYTKLSNFTGYEEYLKLLLAKRDNFSNFQIIKNVFGFFL